MPGSRATDWRPMLVASGAAVASVGLLAAAVAAGWLGPDVGRGATFCEAARSGVVKQPANTWSNAGFVVAGLGVAWRSRRPSRLGLTLARMPALAAAYAVIVVLLGPASAAMHATQSVAGGHLDVLSMYLVAGFAASYAAMRRLARGPVFFGALFAAAVVFCELSGSYGGEVPVVMFAGNLAFGVLLTAAVVIEISIVRQGRARGRLGLGAAAVTTMTVAFAIWLLDQHAWCDPTSLWQGHAAWHLLNAVAAYLLFAYYASERAISEGTRQRSP